MRKHLRKLRKTRVTRDELVGDVIFLAISAFVSFLVVLFFDLHHGFYEWPLEIVFIFDSPMPYLMFVGMGTILGFFILKILVYGLKEEGL
jgi:hypothetical protein